MDPFLDLKAQKKRLLGNIAFLPESDKKRIFKAYELAKKYHSGQLRDEGGLYVLHCLRVASHLIETLGIDDGDFICAAILHDAIEDTELKSPEIKRKFGRKTAQLVDKLTREKLPDETELNRYQRKYQRFLETMRKDSNTRAIKTCDYLDNVMSWVRIPKTHPSRKKFKRWFREAENMYIPLAQTVDRKLVDKMKRALAKVKERLN